MVCYVFLCRYVFIYFSIKYVLGAPNYKICSWHSSTNGFGYYNQLPFLFKASNKHLSMCTQIHIIIDEDNGMVQTCYERTDIGWRLCTLINNIHDRRRNKVLQKIIYITLRAADTMIAVTTEAFDIALCVCNQRLMCSKKKTS